MARVTPWTAASPCAVYLGCGCLGQCCFTSVLLSPPWPKHQSPMSPRLQEASGCPFRSMAVLRLYNRRTRGHSPCRQASSEERLGSCGQGWFTLLMAVTPQFMKSRDWRDLLRVPPPTGSVLRSTEVCLSLFPTWEAAPGSTCLCRWNLKPARAPMPWLVLSDHIFIHTGLGKSPRS